MTADEMGARLAEVKGAGASVAARSDSFFSYLEIERTLERVSSWFSSTTL